jgi:hypothetical protein
MNAEEEKAHFAAAIADLHRARPSSIARALGVAKQSVSSFSNPYNSRRPGPDGLRLLSEHLRELAKTLEMRSRVLAQVAGESPPLTGRGRKRGQ